MTADGESAARGEERSRILVVGILTSILNRGTAALVPLLVIPVGLKFLGATGYGVWATALSITGLIVFADLGIGTGLMTRLGRLQFDNPRDIASARANIASAYIVATLVSAMGLLLLLGSAAWVDWASIVGVPKTQADRGVVEVIVIVTLSAFIANIPGGLIVRVQYGLGQQGISNAWQTLGAVMTLAGTYLGASLDRGSGTFVACAAFAPVSISFLNSISFFAFGTLGRRIRPRLNDANVATIRSLLALGGRFLILSLLVAVSVALDPWIVSKTSAIEEVPNYSVPFRLFALVGSLSVVMTLPLWPLHARALAADDVEWVRRITRRMTAVTGVAVGLASLLAVIGGGLFVSVWLDDQLRVPPALWAGLAFWWVAQSLTGPAFMVQNGAEVLKPQIVGYLVLLGAVPVKWWVSEMWGYEWIPYVGAFFYAMIVWPACYIGYKQATNSITLSGPAIAKEMK